MRTLKIELKDSKAYHLLQELEDKHLIRIVKEPDLSSYALPEEPMNEEDFKEWIEYTNDSPTIASGHALNLSREEYSTPKAFFGQKPTAATKTPAPG